MNAYPQERQGELYTFAAALLWSAFPVTVVLSYGVLGSLTSLAWSTVLAACFFASVMTWRKRWQELKSARIWHDSVLVALFIGVLFYGLYYLGLETTSPGNAAIIALFEVFTTFMFFRLFRGERLSTGYMLGALLMVLGAVLVLGQNFNGFRVGDFIILAATFVTPVGNYYQQRAREVASAETVMFLRSMLSIGPLFAFAVLFGQSTHVPMTPNILLILAINGLLLLGLSKQYWVEAIHRIAVAKAMALASIAPLLTLLIAWIVLSDVPTIWQLVSLIPFLLGILLLTDQLRFTRHTTTNT